MPPMTKGKRISADIGGEALALLALYDIGVQLRGPEDR